MKKLMLIVSILLLVTATFSYVKGREMREITTEIEIAAPPAKVWSILSKIDEWKEWSPVIVDGSGDASLGSKLSITMCGKDGKEGKPGPTYEPVITVLEAPKKLHWRATMMAGFVFTNGKVLVLEDTATGTRLIHKETFSGLMVPMMWGQMESGVPPMLNAMNEALKSKAEQS
jgi:hypothetical protein